MGTHQLTGETGFWAVPARYRSLLRGSRAGVGRNSLKRDAPQSENLHLKEINEAQLAVEAGTRAVGPRGGAESNRHKFQTLGRVQWHRNVWLGVCSSWACV